MSVSAVTSALTLVCLFFSINAFIYQTSDNNEIDKRINVSKIANNMSTMGDNSTAAGCDSRLITVLVQHAHDIVYDSL